MPVLRRLIKVSAVVLGAGLLVTGCSPVKFGAAAITGNERITIATLTTEVTDLSQAVKQYPGTIQMSSAQETQETLTWLVRFQINDELARQAGITVTPPRLRRRWRKYTRPRSPRPRPRACPTSPLPHPGRQRDPAESVRRDRPVPGHPGPVRPAGQRRPMPTTTSAQSATTAKLQHAQCVAAKALAIKINPQFGQLNYTQSRSSPRPTRWPRPLGRRSRHRRPG